MFQAPSRHISHASPAHIARACGRHGLAQVLEIHGNETDAVCLKCGAKTPCAALFASPHGGLKLAGFEKG